MELRNVIEPAGRRSSRARKLDFSGPVVIDGPAPLAPYALLYPGVVLRGLQRCGRPCGPVDGIVRIVPIAGRMVRRLFDVGIVWDERPDAGSQFAPVPSEEDVSARLAVEHLQNARSAWARCRRPVEKPPHQDIRLGSRHFGDRRMARRPSDSVPAGSWRRCRLRTPGPWEDSPAGRAERIHGRKYDP